MNAPPSSSLELDFLGIGELLVDFIAEQRGVALQDAWSFRRHLGGSPSNIAVNIARLGGRAGVIARVGNDPFGHFLRDELASQGVETAGIRADFVTPTSMVFIARGASTPEFLSLRGADMRLSRDDIDPDLIRQSRIIHASAFALASPAARDAITHAFELASDLGKIISLDPNYSPQFWPDRDEALGTLAQIYPLASLTKPSLDDARRLFGAGLSPQAYVARFRALGAKTVVLSMGAEGVLLAPDSGPMRRIPARPASVVDVTGAGDAFWAGFLMALLDGHDLEMGVRVGEAVAALKLQGVGPLSVNVQRRELYRQLRAEIPDPSRDTAGKISRK